MTGDLAGFVPVFGEIYTLVDIMSEENMDLSELGSVLIAAITEKDIAKLTPYADQIGKLGNLSKAVGAIELFKDLASWNSSENIKPKISIYIQQGQNGSFGYETYVNNDNSFKEMWSGFTGTVIKPDDHAFTVIYK